MLNESHSKTASRFAPRLLKRGVASKTMRANIHFFDNFGGGIRYSEF